MDDQSLETTRSSPPLMDGSSQEQHHPEDCTLPRDVSFDRVSTISEQFQPDTQFAPSFLVPVSYKQSKGFEHMLLTPDNMAQDVAEPLVHPDSPFSIVPEPTSLFPGQGFDNLGWDAWRPTRSYIELIPVMNMTPRSAFESRKISERPKPVPAPPAPLSFIPRPLLEYQALIRGPNTGTRSFHVEQQQGHQNDPDTPSWPSSYDTPAAHCAPKMFQAPTYPPPEEDHVRRKWVKDAATLSAASKRVRLDRAELPEPTLVVQEYQVPRPHTPAGVPRSLSASQLIGNQRDNKARAGARPWGLQRILTHRFVTQKAARLRVPVPQISNEDVNLFCYSTDSPFKVMLSTFVPDRVDIRFLGDIEITAEEILTFFPNHLKWLDASFRLTQNGWSANDMAKYINYAHDLKVPNHSRGNTVLVWVQAANKVILDVSKDDRRKWKTMCFTTKNWIPHKNRSYVENIDYFLVDLADGVARMPEGDGARLLTRAIRLAIARGHVDVKLSQIQQYFRANLLIFPPLLSMKGQMMAGRHPDAVAHLQFKARLREMKEEQAGSLSGVMDENEED